MTEPLGRIRLAFADDHKKRSKQASACLSGIEQVGRDLYLVGDEGVCLHRLSPDGKGGYGDHESIDLTGPFGLGDADGDGEADLEGLCRDGGSLWLCGSHSRKRKKIDSAADADALSAFAEPKLERNRLLLGRLPIANPDTVGATVVAAAGRRAERFEFLDGKKRTELTEAFKKDRLLGPFLDIPSKEGGLDVEGIAARGPVVLVGLRGPVLRAYAVVVRLNVVARGGWLRLDKAAGAGMTIQLLDLDGLGVRDLAVHGNDLLVLAGPTMQLDGPSLVFRWHGAFDDRDAVVNPANLERILSLPYGYRRDHAEGICVLQRDGRPPRLVVVYDSPAAGRSDDGGSYYADVFAIPE